MRYDTAALRNMLSDAFSDDDVTALCYDHFRPVHESFGTAFGKTQKIQRLLEYCDRHDQVDKLIPLVEKHNPAVYERYRQEVEITEPPVTSRPRPSQPRKRPRAFRLGIAALILVLLGGVALISTLQPLPSAQVSEPEPIVVDDFEEVGTSGGLTWWDFGGGTFVRLRTNERSHSGSYALRIKFAKRDTFEFIGAEIPDGLARNLNQGQAVQVWIYGTVSILLKLELADRQAYDVSTRTATNPAGWTQLTFDYSSLAAQGKLADVKNLLFFIAPGDATATGTIFLDDVAIVSGQGPTTPGGSP